LLFKGTVELHEKLESRSQDYKKTVAYAGFGVVVSQIVVLDAVFSLDAVITAVGMVDHLAVMMTAVIIAIGVMMAASKPLTHFISAHPTLIILCLGFLLMIGFSLVADGFGFHIPKGYLYAAIGFSILIESLNQVASYNRRRFFSGNSPLRERTADLVLKLIRGRPDPAVVGTDIAAVAAPADASPVFNPVEQKMVENVLKLAGRPVQSVMTPRPDIIWIDADSPADSWRHFLEQYPFNRYLLARGDLDQLLGVVEARALLNQVLSGMQLNPSAANLTQPLVLPEQITALNALEVIRRHAIPIAMVVDEYGSIQGIVTSDDLLAAIAGEPEVLHGQELPMVVSTGADKWDVDGTLDLSELRTLLSINALPDSRGFYTTAGLLLVQFGKVPKSGDWIELENYRLTVAEMEGHRIKRIRIEKQPISFSA
jgi:CBS domain containing-hemolysin-like protein